MKICLNQNQFLDDAGRPLSAGRVTVLDHDSSIASRIYTLTGSVFSEAANPYTMDADGRIPTLWFDDAVVDVRVERRLSDGSFEQVDTYEAGFKLPDTVNDTILYGIDALKQADTALGTVEVVGYDSSVSAPFRTYRWQDGSQATADDGIVVESSTGASGRWVLDWPDDTLPCTVYGVAPGHEANMAALLSYQEVVGTVRTPPKVRFVRGTYSTTGTMATEKTLVFDMGAKFTSAVFSTLHVEIAQWDSYVADFTGISKNDAAHSSWFRSVKRFFACQARNLYQDSTNWFTDTAISSIVGCASEHLHGRAIQGITFANQGQLVFSNCLFDAGSVSNLWKTRWHNTNFSDRIFRIDGAWDIGANPTHRIDVRAADGNTALPQDFKDLSVYAAYLVYNGVRTLDLAGGTISSASGADFDIVRNGTVLNLYAPSGVLNANGLRIGSLSFTGGDMLMVDSEATVYALSGGTFNARNSYLTLAATVSLQDTSVILDGCMVTVSGGARVYPADPANLMTNGSLNAKDCQFTGLDISCNRISIVDSVLSGCDITAYPRADILGGFALNLLFDRNTFDGTLYVEPSPALGVASAAKECSIANLSIVGNRFVRATGGGVVFPYWAQDGASRFIAGSCTYTGTGIQHVSYGQPFHIKGNTGYCPADCPDDTEVRNGSTDPNVSIVSAAGWPYAVVNTVNAERVFCLPADSDTTSPRCSGGAELRTVATGISNAGKVGQFPGSALFPACALDTSLPNDMFTVRVGILTDRGPYAVLSSSKSA